MLYFISLGLYDENDMSLKALNRAKNCDILFLESYTQPNINKEKLEKLFGKKIEILSRKQIEESDIIFKQAKEKNVGLLVGGDCFSATTHSILKKEAEEKGIKVEVIHGSSIFSAIAECGLHLYKFGKTASITFPERTGNEIPKSVFDIIKQNQSINAHTLLLLDIDIENEKYMNVRQALEILSNELGENIEVVVCSRLGGNTSIKFGKIKDLKNLDFGKIPHVIIIPSKLHFTEKECLERYRI